MFLFTFYSKSTLQSRCGSRSITRLQELDGTLAVLELSEAGAAPACRQLLKTYPVSSGHLSVWR